MDDDDLALLQKSHRASGKALRGRAITPPEEAALHAVVKMLEPALSPVEKSRTRQMLREISEISEQPATRWTPATPKACRLRGRFF